MNAHPNGAGRRNGSRPQPAVTSIPPPQQLRLPGSMHRMGAVAMPLEKATDLRRGVRRLAGRLRNERAGVIAILVLAVASVTSAVLGPKILGHGTDILVNGLRDGGRRGVDFGALHRVLLSVAALYLGASLLSYLQGYLLTGVVQRTMFRLRGDVETKLNRLPLRYIDQHARGDLLSRVTNDIDNLAQSLQQTLSQMVTSVLTLVGTLTMMFVVSPVLALVATITIPVSLLTTRVVARRSRARFIAQWQETGALDALVEEAFTGHAVVKAFGRQHEVEDRFRALNDELYQSSFGAQFLSGSIQPLMMVIGNLDFVAIAVIGGLRVASGTMTIGGVQAFLQYSRHFTHPLTQIASVVNVFQSGIASAERIFELLDAEEQSPDRGDAVFAAPVLGRIEFDHVTFSYDPARPLIRDLSFAVSPGQTVAIVGPTGAGKTTLVNLLMRFYELHGGRILLDGVDITTISRRELRGNMGMVLQDTWLFGGTIHDNIAYGNPTATEDEIGAAARATFVDRFVRSLPDGYETMTDDEDSSVSAGEKQLLTIARAFLADPAILILDEATSSVDTRTEVLIQHAMAALRANRTSFVIAHRLSTIRNADVILVMEDGRIVETGDHETLLASGGAYARLYRAQFSAAAADVA